MPDFKTPTFTPKKPQVPQAPEIPDGFDGVAVPSPNGEATYYSHKGLKVGSRVAYIDENGAQRAWVIQSLNEEKDADGQTYIKAEHVDEGGRQPVLAESRDPSAPMPAVPGIGTLSQGSGPSPVERFQEMIRGARKSVIDAIHGQVAVPTALIEDRLFGRPGEAAAALRAEDPTAGTAFGRAFGQGVAPAGGGLAAAGAGAGVGAEIGGLFGPVGGAVGGVVGGIGGGMLGGAKAAQVQDELLKRLLSPRAAAALEASNAEIAEKQPAARDAGALAAQALFARPNLSLTAPAMGSRLAGGAIAGGIDAAQQKITTGEIDLAQTGRQIAGGALLSGSNTKAGNLLHEAGAAAGTSVAAPVVRFTRRAASEAASPTGGITLYSGINPRFSRVSARRSSPPFVPLEKVPASARGDVVLPGYVLPADQAARPATGLSQELVTTRPGNLGALAERAKVAVKPVSQTVTVARQAAADGSLSPDHLFLMNLRAALQDDHGVNFAAWDRLRVGEDPITGLYTQGGIDFLTAPGIDGRLAGANRLGPGQEAIERSTTGAGSVSLDYFHPADHPRLARRAKGEFNAIGVGTPEMLRGNVQAPALYLSALHAHALARGAADVEALEGALKAAVQKGRQGALDRAANQVEKKFQAAFGDVSLEELRQDVNFKAAVETHAASAGYSFDPSGKGDLRTIMENLPFGSFDGRRSFVEVLDKSLQASGHDFPSLAAHTEIMSAFPAQEFGRRSGNVIGGSWYDFNNPLGLPASALGAPTHTGYEIGYSGAPAGRLTAGRFLDFHEKGSPLSGAVPFWEVASQLRMGARDANGNLVLGKRLGELPAEKQNWNTVSKTGPWFVADADKPAVLAKLDEILKGIETDGNDSRSVSRSVTDSGTAGGSAAAGDGQGISPSAGGGGAASLHGEGGLLPGREGVPGQSAGTGDAAAGGQPVSDAPEPDLGGSGSERRRIPGVEPTALPHRMRLRIQEDHPVGAALYSGIDPRAISEGLRILGGGFKSAEPDGASAAQNLTTWRKAGLLTNPATHARNILGNAGMQVSEEAARLPAAIADMARVAVAKAVGGEKTALGRTLGTERTTLGTDLVAAAKASLEGATRGGREALEILRTGKVENDRFDSGVELEKLGIDREYASKSPLANFYVNGIFRTLSAEDRVFRTYAFARSISEQADLVARLEAAALKKEGKPVTKRWQADRAAELHAKPTDAMQAQAIVDAEVATFNNTNIANEAFTAFRQKAKASPLFSTALDTFFPFTRTPTNVLARILEYSIGAAYGPLKAGREVFKDLVNEQKLAAAQKELSAAKAAQVGERGTGGYEAAKVRFNRAESARAELQKAAAAAANKAFTPAEQRAFAQTFGRGSVGLGLMVLGYKLADKGLMTGSNVSASDYQKREKAKTAEGAVYAGGMWHDVGFLAPVGTMLVLGATIREQQGRGVAMPLALAGGVAQQVGEAPMLSGTDQFKDLGDAKQFERLIGGMAGSFVPAAVAATAQAMDTRRRKLKPGGEKGGFIAGTIDSARQRLPGLREDVPVDKKAPRRPASSPFNPFRSKAGPKSKPGLFKKKEAPPAVEKDELEMRIERRLSKFD